MYTCKDASRLISEKQDRSLGLWEKFGLRFHLWMCDSCQVFDKQIGYLRKAVRRSWAGGDVPAANELPSDARLRIRQALEDTADDSRD